MKIFFHRQLFLRYFLAGKLIKKMTTIAAATAEDKPGVVVPKPNFENKYT